MIHHKSTALIAIDKSGTRIQSKDREYYPKRQVLLLPWSKLMTHEAYWKTDLNDACRTILDFRYKKGHDIDGICRDNRCKLYWLELDNQPTLFGKEVCNG